MTLPDDYQTVKALVDELSDLLEPNWVERLRLTNEERKDAETALNVLRRHQLAMILIEVEEIVG